MPDEDPIEVGIWTTFAAAYGLPVAEARRALAGQADGARMRRDLDRRNARLRRAADRLRYDL